MSKLQKKLRKIIYTKLIANGINQQDASSIATGLSKDLKSLFKENETTKTKDMFRIFSDPASATIYAQNLRTKYTKTYETVELFYFMFNGLIKNELEYIIGEYDKQTNK